jgi:hypothetical protein
MPNQLTDLVVEYVSLVDRAAVRDAEKPDEPMRFLLWKRDGGATDQSVVGQTIAAIRRTTEAHARTARAASLMKEAAALNPQIEALKRDIEALQTHHQRKDDVMYTSALAEAQAKAAQLRKSDSTLSEIKALEKAFDSDHELAARYQGEVRDRGEQTAAAAVPSDQLAKRRRLADELLKLEKADRDVPGSTRQSIAKAKRDLGAEYLATFHGRAG